MKLRREFVKKAHPNGNLVYRRQQNLLFPIRLRSIAVEWCNATRQKREHHMALTKNGEPLGELDFVGDEPALLKFSKPLAIPRGMIEFRVVCTGFQPDERIDGVVTVDVTGKIK